MIILKGPWLSNNHWNLKFLILRNTISPNIGILIQYKTSLLMSMISEANVVSLLLLFAKLWSVHRTLSKNTVFWIALGRGGEISCISYLKLACNVLCVSFAPPTTWRRSPNTEPWQGGEGVGDTLLKYCGTIGSLPLRGCGVREETRAGLG